MCGLCIGLILFLPTLWIWHLEQKPFRPNVAAKKTSPFTAMVLCGSGLQNFFPFSVKNLNCPPSWQVCVHPSPLLHFPLVYSLYHYKPIFVYSVSSFSPVSLFFSASLVSTHLTKTFIEKTLKQKQKYNRHIQKGQFLCSQ